MAVEIAKLPKWAQDHIRSLESDLSAVKDALALRNGEFAGGRIVISPYNDLQKIVFPDHTTVRFNVADGSWRDYFDVRLDHKTGIEVHCGSQMAILPRVSNVVSIRRQD